MECVKLPTTLLFCVTQQITFFPVYISLFYVQEHKTKQPYYIHFDGDRVMRMAGLYDSWQDAEANWLTTYTILTTDSSKRLQWCAQSRTTRYPPISAAFLGGIWLHVHCLFKSGLSGRQLCMQAA